jgi:outer membrane protein OmpA-like peptidoglycan-associated protein
MRLSIFLFLIGHSFMSRAQNLVPNGGFENYRTCPGDHTQHPSEFSVNSWFSPSVSGTPDYFNVCSHGEADVPHNWAGVSDPYEGVGYAGLYLWAAMGRNYREYLQTELSERLVRDSLYYLEFHYKLSSYSKYSIDRIGLLLTDSLVRLNHDLTFNVTPTFSIIKDTALTTETGLWEEGKILYKARGGEKFLLIGNFFDNKTTHFYKIQFRPIAQVMLSHYAYYYIDDVSVVPKHVRDQQILAQRLPDFEIGEVKANTNYVLKNINFQLDSYRLIPPSFTELDKVADYLLKHVGHRVQLFGHTDDQGSEKYNLKLSQARAKNVADYLASVGVAMDRIDHFGYGESQPVKEGISEEARTLNRRVEIRFVSADR